MNEVNEFLIESHLKIQLETKLAVQYTQSRHRHDRARRDDASRARGSRRPRRVRVPQVRIGRTSSTTRAQDRGERPHSHVHSGRSSRA